MLIYSMNSKLLTSKIVWHKPHTFNDNTQHSHSNVRDKPHTFNGNTQHGDCNVKTNQTINNTESLIEFTLFSKASRVIQKEVYLVQS